MRWNRKPRGRNGTKYPQRLVSSIFFQDNRQYNRSVNDQTRPCTTLSPSIVPQLADVCIRECHATPAQRPAQFG
jgi:hypothetical protein